MFSRLGLNYRTVKHMKPMQVRYRLWYMLRGRLRKLAGHSYSLSIPKKGRPLSFKKGITKPASNKDDTYTFLNQSQTFSDSIDWNFDNYGKLWAYNLNYFDYLLQEEISTEQGLELMNEFINQIEENHEGLEPYPISIRGMNWIKFLSNYEIEDPEIDGSLYTQYQMLMDNREYHLLGNHLLENGCSLLFGAYYFQDEKLLEVAKEILNEQLDEQVLSDGGHFERSTMYHHIILDRLLDCYNLVANNEAVFQEPALEEKLQQKVILMLGWANEMAMGEGEMPLLNDAAEEIAPSLLELQEYAGRLGVTSKKMHLSSSGYIKYKEGPFELLCDVGNIGPDYIPGHAHSDTFSFVLYCDGKPVIIDPGISTYENNDRRQRERSTSFHNTVQLEDKEQSEVWDAFRVGRRAYVHDVRERQSEKGISLSAWHDGYQPWGVRHTRKWAIENNGSQIIIYDELISNKDERAHFRLHFHHNWEGKIYYEEGKVTLGNLLIYFDSETEGQLKSFNCPAGYNQYIQCPKFEITFVNSLTTTIEFIS